MHSHSFFSSAFATRLFPVPWSLVHHLFRHCDTPTNTIRQCNYPTQKLSSSAPNANLNICCDIPSWHKKNLPVLWSSWGQARQCRTQHIDVAHKKRHPATQQNSSNVWVSWLCALTQPNPGYDVAHLTELHLSMVNGVLLDVPHPTPD